MKNTLLYAFIVCFVVSSCSQKHKETVVKPITTHKKGIAALKVAPAILGYDSIYPDPVIKNLHMIGHVGRNGVQGDMGKILRVLRYKNIACANEGRYVWLHADTLLALAAQETGGADLLPNGADDGGAGVIHKQPSLAAEYGLHSFNDCTAKICHKDGRALREAMSEESRRELIEQDDRMNPLQDMDATARMLTFYAHGRAIKGHANYTPLQKAICRYSGAFNYPIYYKHVMKYVRLLNSPSYLKKVEKKFNEMNPNLTINGEKADFKKYIEVCQRQNENYGLAAYKKLGVVTLQ